MCKHPPTRELVSLMMAETLDIAHAVGAEPSVSIERRLAGAERVGEHKPSTLQDLEAGKPLELAALIDAVVELADLTGHRRAVPAGGGRGQRVAGRVARAHLNAWCSRRATPLRTAAAATAAATDSATRGLKTLGMM